MPPHRVNHGGKITDKKLLDFLDLDTDETVRVLLEVEAPEPVVVHKGKPRRRTTGTQPEFVEFPKESEQAERRAIEDTRSLLNSLHLHSRFSRSGRVFAVEINPHQLRAILAAPTIRTVIPNRRVSVV